MEAVTGSPTVGARVTTGGTAGTGVTELETLVTLHEWEVFGGSDFLMVNGQSLEFEDGKSGGRAALKYCIEQVDVLVAELVLEHEM